MPATEDLYVALGARLRAARERIDLTQAALARRSGVGRTTITNIEAGNQTVSLDLLYRLATAVDIPPQELLPSAAVPEVELTDARTKTLSEWDRRFVATIVATQPPALSRSRGR